MKLRLKTFIVSILLFNIIIKAQPKKVIADRIVAQVGDKIILRSDVMNSIADFKRNANGNDNALPPDPECAFIEGLLIQKALILQAERDSLPVSKEEIEAAIENRIRAAIRQYGSQQALEEIAEKSVFQIKEDFKSNFRENKLAEAMRAKIIENIKVTPNEVQEFYNRIPKDSLSYYESELELQQIVLIPKANKDVDDYIIKQLYDFKRSVENGTKRFDQLAKLYTDDPGSKETGGQYNMNRGEKFWDPAFFATAFKLKEGQISNVVKSKFGYHIIQLVSRNGDDIVIRHILKIPPITDDEVKLSISKLDSIKNLLVKKEIDFGYALSRYCEEDIVKQNGGQISGRDGSGFITIDQLDKEMVAMIKDIKPGEYTKPMVYTDEQGQKKVRMIYYKSRTNPHRENVKDDYNKLAERLMQEKKQQRLENWFKERIPYYYIVIDDEFKTCKSLSDWMKYAKSNK